MKIRALCIIKDDAGNYIRAPQTVEVSEGRGRELISLGGAEPAKPNKESGGKDAASGSSADEKAADETPVDRDALIRQALTEMLAEDPEQQNNLLWTGAGKPRNKTVDQRTGLEVKNEEIEPIWAALQSAGE